MWGVASTVPTITTLLPRKARRLSTGASGACHARLQSKVGAIFILGTIVASKKHGTNNHELRSRRPRAKQIDFLCSLRFVFSAGLEGEHASALPRTQ